MKYLLLFALLASCTVGHSHSDGGTLDGELDQHLCDPSNVSQDYYNCGSCNNHCFPDYTDHCYLGQCLCGTQGPCEHGTGCKFGRCILPDPRGAVCEFDSTCPLHTFCIAGRCTYVSCTPEICDGIDNDCDGVVDGDLTSQLNRPCPNAALVLPPCTAGRELCYGGYWTECIPGVQPAPEQGLHACDGIDNDCDGCIDGVFSPTTEGCVIPPHNLVDVLFVIDISGSMADKINNVRNAVNTFSEMYSSNPDFEFGVVVLPYPINVVLYQDLTNFTTFSVALTNMPLDGGDIEPTFDAIYEIGNGMLPVSWRSGSSRIIFLFTDEQAQTLTNIDEVSVCGVLTHGEVFIAFLDPEYFSDFTLCSFAEYRISSTVDGIHDVLMSTAQEPCAP